MSIYHRDIQDLKLRANANVCHDDAAEMFGRYGWHVSTDKGDYCLQVVDTAWLEGGKTEAEIVELILAESRVDDRDVAANIADKALSVWADMVSVEKALERAANAYLAGDLAECVEALCTAYDQEVDHGDAPSTNFLAEGILEVVEEA